MICNSWFDYAYWSTKFEGCGFSCSRDMKEDPKRKIWGDMGWLESLKVIGNVSIRQNAYDFLFIFHRNYASILYHFQDITNYLLKLSISPAIFVAPNGGDLSGISARSVATETRIAGLSCGVVCVRIHLAVLVELQLATDRQTDRQRDRHRAIAYIALAIASCGKNKPDINILLI